VTFGCGEAEQHRAVVGIQAVHFLELLFRAGKADLQSFDLPSQVFCSASLMRA
jgi:hypothetical protein